MLLAGGTAARGTGCCCRGASVGIEPIRASGRYDVAAARLPAERGLVEHRGQPAGLLIVAHRLEQRPSREHDHAVAGGEVLLRAVDNRVHGLLDRLILERNADDTGIAFAPTLHAPVEAMIVRLVLHRTP